MALVLGSVNRTTQGHENWIGEGWVGYLTADSKFIYGRWHRHGDLWEFSPEDSAEIETIFAQHEWEVLDGYWGQRAKLVLDETRKWSKAVFQPTGAIRVNRPGGTLLRPATESDTDGERIEDGWDHEHCAICWEKLGRGVQPLGYICTQSVWICEHCFVDFVQQRSLAFIPSG